MDKKLRQQFRILSVLDKSRKEADSLYEQQKNVCISLMLENEIQNIEVKEESYSLVIGKKVSIDEDKLKRLLKKKNILKGKVFKIQKTEVFDSEELNNLVKEKLITKKELRSISVVKENKPYIRIGKVKESDLIDKITG